MINVYYIFLSTILLIAIICIINLYLKLFKFIKYMFTTIICTILLLVLTFISYFRYKDVLAAPFVLTLIYFLDFLFFIIINFIKDSKYWLNTYAYYFIIGQLVFIFAYDLTFNLKLINKNSITSVNVNNNYQLTAIYKIFIFVQLLVFLYSIFNMIYYLYDIYGFNIFSYIAAGKRKKFFEPYYIGLVKTIGFGFSFLAFNRLFRKNVVKKDEIWLFLQITISILFLLLNFSRQWLFIFLIPVFFIYLKSKNINNKKLLLVSIILCLIFVIFVVIQCIVTSLPVNIDYFRLYLNSGIVAFTEWVKRPFETFDGKYTFRIFFAVLKKIGLYHGEVPYLPLEYLEVDGLDWNIGLGNVYTFYYGFVKDFGLFYGLIIQFVVGLFHGFLYNKAENTKLEFWIIVCGIFYMPLVVHFFMEHYFSHISLWIQIIFPVFIAIKTQLFYRAEQLKYD